MSFFTKLVDRTFAVGGAILFLQAPQFIQSYTQTLAGHLAEVSWQMDQMRSMAEKSGKSLTGLVTKFLTNGDPDIVFQGQMIDMLIEREATFSLAYRKLLEATPFTKPFVFISNLNWDLVKETWQQFKMGLPLTAEGIVWGFVGLVLGYLMFRGLAQVANMFRRNKRGEVQVSSK